MQLIFLGAADFLPDFVEASQKSGLPKYTGLPSIMKKLNAWLKQVKVLVFFRNTQLITRTQWLNQEGILKSIDHLSIDHLPETKFLFVVLNFKAKPLIIQF